MFSGPFSDLNFQKIKDLSLPESETIDYKEKVENSDTGKRDFAIDICSLANTEGGDLVIGIREHGLIPTDYPGIDSPADEQERLNNIIASRIEPRIHGIMFKSLETGISGKYLLVVRVPKSYNGPHIEISKHCFYRRHNHRNDPMSWKEISESFLSKRSVFDKIHEFLKGRIQGFFQSVPIDYKYLGPPVALSPGITAIIHLIPIESFEKNESLDIQGIRMRYGNVGPFPLILTREGIV